jgi:hypothetical protein
MVLPNNLLYLFLNVWNFGKLYLYWNAENHKFCVIAHRVWYLVYENPCGPFVGFGKISPKPFFHGWRIDKMNMVVYHLPWKIVLMIRIAMKKISRKD